MKKYCLLVFISISVIVFSQYSKNVEKKEGHQNESAFKELDSELPTPNNFRTASGAPGHEYYQQKADYKIAITLNDDKQTITGNETISYHNNSPDILEYLWVQLDQNNFSPDTEGSLVQQESNPYGMNAEEFSKKYVEKKPAFGFNITSVTDANQKALSHDISFTMMRINLEKPLLPGETFVFNISWNYLVNDYLKYGGRSGYEYFPKDDNRLYIIAQFFPRMAVYNDVEGWQNMQFWGRSEFALPFGDYEVDVTLPSDMVINGTGTITNLQENLTTTQWKRWQNAQKSYQNPVLIITQEEAIINEKSRSKQNKTWHFSAQNVRDFAFSCSRKFIWDAMAVKMENKDVMAISLYPKEGNPLWEKYSTRAVAHTLREYSRMTFDYPYEKAISVHADDQGMEYPMICWNYGRPDEKGIYSDATKFGMISVIIHEVGHNYFPMIVNSDERQWTWMDEGLNTFLQFVAEQNMDKSFPDEFNTTDKKYPSRRGFAKDIVDYMSSQQDYLEPIMTQGDHVFNFGANAYGKPATGLNILRETVIGRKNFDYAFKTYANRWKFKHPTPADFFRTMEDASGTDLDWFWRGWFYSTDFCDIAVEKVTPFVLEYQNKSKGIFELTSSKEIEESDYKKFKEIKEYVDALPSEQKTMLSHPKHFYQIEFSRPGKLIMPLLVTLVFEDGTTQEIRYPYMVWRLHENRNLKKFFAFDKALKEVRIDEKLETADIDTNNNTWKK